MSQDSVKPDADLTSSAQQTDQSEKSKAKIYDLSTYDSIFQMFKDELPEVEIGKQVTKFLKSLQSKHELDTYFIILLYDEHSSLNNYEANKIYEAAAKNNKQKNILLVINNLGGKVEAGYLISKTCKRLSQDKFVTVIPRRAKSAATLIALGANEVHMGIMSELGPIDPQIGGYPALALGNSLNVLAELSKKYPESSGMLAEYLSKKLELTDLGYFERVSESAAQYAERLLEGKKLPQGQTPQKLAKQFVYDYKDHGFVIDIDESSHLLGDMIKTNTPEYSFANDVYRLLSYLDMIYHFLKEQDFSFVGSIDDRFTLRDQSKR
jgi:ClpP class serine protease